MTADGPALKGTTNIVLDRVDHRETALSPRAFAEIHAFMVGHSVANCNLPEADVTLNGAVTGQPSGRG